MLPQCPFEETNAEFVGFTVFVGLPPFIPPAVACCKCGLPTPEITPFITTDPIIEVVNPSITP